VAPDFILAQLSKSAERMLSKSAAN
jgi:hypothetical protein